MHAASPTELLLEGEGHHMHSVICALAYSSLEQTVGVSTPPSWHSGLMIS